MFGGETRTRSYLNFKTFGNRDPQTSSDEGAFTRRKRGRLQGVDVHPRGKGGGILRQNRPIFKLNLDLDALHFRLVCRKVRRWC